MSDVSGFGLQKKQKVPIFLCFLVIWEEALLRIFVVEMAGNFVLLRETMSYFSQACISREIIVTYLFKRHPVLNEQSYPRVQISDIFFKNEILLRLRGDLRFEFPQIFLSCSEPIRNPNL
jgi:hypothetical protein